MAMTVEDLKKAVIALIEKDIEKMKMEKREYLQKYSATLERKKVLLECVKSANTLKDMEEIYETIDSESQISVNAQQDPDFVGVKGTKIDTVIEDTKIDGVEGTKIDTVIEGTKIDGVIEGTKIDTVIKGTKIDTVSEDTKIDESNVDETEKDKETK